MSPRTTTFIVIAVIVLAIAAVGAVMLKKGSAPEEPAPAVESFSDCVRAGYSVMESYPRQCRTPDGRNFTEDIGNEPEKNDLIRIDAPRPNATIVSPLTITGEARGYWYFEASFTARLLDGEGNELAVRPVEAQSEWMTENFVPFEAELTFDAPETTTGTLRLERANPSGLPENDDALIVPVRFE